MKGLKSYHLYFLSFHCCIPLKSDDVIHESNEIKVYSLVILGLVTQTCINITTIAQIVMPTLQIFVSNIP